MLYVVENGDGYKKLGLDGQNEVEDAVENFAYHAKLIWTLAEF